MTETTASAALGDARGAARMTIETLGMATDYARRVLAELTHDDLRRPTPCDGWDAGRVAVHLADVVDGLIALIETGQLALPQPPRTGDPDPVALVLEQLTRLTQVLAEAADGSRVAQAAVAGAIELATHSWDIGVCLDPAHRIPESLAREVLALVSPILTVDVRGTNFASPVDLPQAACASDRLVAFLGRSPRR